MRPMSKRTVDSVLRAVSLGVCLMNTDSSFVVAQVIPPLCISSSSVQEGTFISFWADSCGLIILGTVNIRAVVKCTVPAADRSATTLVDKVPVEASVGQTL